MGFLKNRRNLAHGLYHGTVRPSRMCLTSTIPNQMNCSQKKKWRLQIVDPQPTDLSRNSSIGSCNLGSQRAVLESYGTANTRGWNVNKWGCHASSNRCLTSSNKKLLVTSATLVVTGALLWSWMVPRSHTAIFSFHLVSFGDTARSAHGQASGSESIQKSHRMTPKTSEKWAVPVPVSIWLLTSDISRSEYSHQLTFPCANTSLKRTP